jgi:hypothetical protein
VAIIALLVVDACNEWPAGLKNSLRPGADVRGNHAVGHRRLTAISGLIYLWRNRKLVSGRHVMPHASPAGKIVARRPPNRDCGFGRRLAARIRPEGGNPQRDAAGTRSGDGGATRQESACVERARLRGSYRAFMKTVIVTGAAGLIGSESVKRFAREGFQASWGIDNDLRQWFFGKDASTLGNRQKLIKTFPNYEHHDFDIRDRAAVENLFQKLGQDVVLIIHTAAQPSHDWAARDPHADFSVNAVGTLNLLQATRSFAPKRSSFSLPPTRFMATRPTGCRWSNWKSAGKSSPATNTNRAFPRP